MRELHIFTEGDQQRGLGHLTRCSAYAAVGRKMGLQVQWFVDGDKNAKKILTSEKVHWCQWQETPIKSAPLNGIAIVDSYSALITVLNSIANSYFRVIYIDDTYRVTYPKGLVIHASPDAPKPTQGDAIWKLGPSWQPMRPAFEKIKSRTNTKEHISEILIIMGGTDIREMTIPMANIAHEIYPNAKLHIVTNKKISIPNFCYQHNNIDAWQMASLMQRCDLAISAAGQTTYELARCGLPSIIISVANNQIEQMNGWRKNGGFEIAGSWDDPAIESHCKMLLKKLENQLLRSKKSHILQSIIDGNAVSKTLEWAMNC